MLVNGHVPEIKYPVWVARGALNNIFDYIPDILKTGRVAAVTDREVFALHLPALRSQFEARGVAFHVITVDGSEAGKNLESVLNVYDHLNDLTFTSEDTIIAFGGGSVLDIAAFAASTYLGGVGYWQIPTTLLAMIDSSVSTSCRLNFRSSKDMIKIDACPQGVIIDPDLLGTLTEKQMANGYVRMIQYGYLRNPELIKMLEATEQDISELITTSINCKLELMTRDPFFLSFGQPFSDAIQGHFRFLKYSHGESVALGMLASSPSERLTDLLEKYKLPVTIEGVTSETLVRRAAKICQLHGHQYRFIKVQAPGQIQIESIESEDYEKVLAKMITVIENK
ncbi:MAG: 3-dehydroquinate synthase [Clostridiaceae bacterium]|nr:3-dehydroquinate synthase [Clostridiaceae bacterium]